MQARIDAKIEAKAAAGPTGRQVGASTHFQPTPRSIAAAEEKLGEVSAETVAAVRQAMLRARAADSAGDKNACEQALAEVHTCDSSLDAALNGVQVETQHETHRHEPSRSALDFGAASGLSAAGCDGPASSTGCQLSLFICRIRRLATDDVSPGQGRPAGADQAVRRDVRPGHAGEGRGRGGEAGCEDDLRSGHQGAYQSHHAVRCPRPKL